MIVYKEFVSQGSGASLKNCVGQLHDFLTQVQLERRRRYNPADIKVVNVYHKTTRDVFQDEDVDGLVIGNFFALYTWFDVPDNAIHHFD